MDFSPSSVTERSPKTPSAFPLPRAAFRLKLLRKGNGQQGEVRWAIYNPYSSSLVWEESGASLIEGSRPDAEDFFAFAPISTETPGTKTHRLKLIKIQVGFGCNFSCGYCSQKTFRPASGIGNMEEAEAFLRNFGTWYDGGEDGKGGGTRIDFLGGETLLYWNLVRTLARGIKDRYPNISFSLYTNGSVVISDLAEESLSLNLQVMFSHDGLAQKQNRGLDPLEEPKTQAFLQDLATRLSPHNLFLVQMTLGKGNFALAANRDLLSKALGMPAHLVPLAFDIVHAFDHEAKELTPGNLDELSRFQQRVLSEFRQITWAQALSFVIFRMDLMGFLEPLLGRSSMAQAYQRCEMDKPTSIAVDLKGNVLTCQNTTARGGHKIGQLNDFANISLNTGLHWSNRESCRKCPVVSMCKGACMYTKGDEFEKTCDSMFGYYLSVLAFSLENIVGWQLVEIEGENIRARGQDKIPIA